MNQPLNPKVPYFIYIQLYILNSFCLYFPSTPLFGTLLYGSPKVESITKESTTRFPFSAQECYVRPPQLIENHHIGFNGLCIASAATSVDRGGEEKSEEELFRLGSSKKDRL